jgi:hypothetical protein
LNASIVKYGNVIERNVVHITVKASDVLLQTPEFERRQKWHHLNIHSVGCRQNVGVFTASVVEWPIRFTVPSPSCVVDVKMTTAGPSDMVVELGTAASIKHDIIWLHVRETQPKKTLASQNANTNLSNNAHFVLAGDFECGDFRIQIQCNRNESC